MLEIKNVTKQYNQKTVLNNVSLTLTDGVYGLLGPNGAGKSTMMNIITGNLPADNGNVLWDNADICKLKDAYRSLLGYAPQQQGLYDTFTGKRFLSYMGTLKGISKKELAAEITRCTEYVNLSEKIDLPINTYSGGMKQRLLIAQAMMGDPKLIIMDEPTAGLDPKERVRIRNKIKDLSDGRIILIATHVVSDIQSIAKEVIILKEGEIIAKDSVDALCRQFNSDDLEDVYMTLFGEEENDAFVHPL